VRRRIDDLDQCYPTAGLRIAGRNLVASGRLLGLVS